MVTDQYSHILDDDQMHNTDLSLSFSDSYPRRKYADARNENLRINICVHSDWPHGNEVLNRKKEFEIGVNYPNGQDRSFFDGVSRKSGRTKELAVKVFIRREEPDVLSEISPFRLENIDLGSLADIGGHWNMHFIPRDLFPKKRPHYSNLTSSFYSPYSHKHQHNRTSVRTPTVVASAAGLVVPNRAIATATASSKKFDAPIIPAGAAISCGNFW